MELDLKTTTLSALSDQDGQHWLFGEALISWLNYV
jgi:hypothetical protein